MASPELLDFEALLTPIAGEQPAGANLREDISPNSLYYQIKDARNKARAAERTMIAGDEGGERPDWSPLIDLVPKALAEQSKDLELTAWLIEALVRLGGFAGMRDGFRLARELCENFWDGLYPMPDEDGIETRVSPLSGLNGEDGPGTLIIPIAQIPITGDGEHGAFATWQFRQASDLARMDDERRAKREAAGALTLETFEKAVNAGTPQFYGDLVEDIQAAQEEFAKLGAVLDGHCGHDSPPTTKIREAIEDVANAVQYIAKDRLPIEAPAAEEPGAPAEAGAPGAAPAPARPAGVIATRADALEALRKVATYFRTIEPHSPIPYVLERAVRWGEMPLPQLLQELIPDDGARTTFEKLTGVRATSEG